MIFHYDEDTCFEAKYDKEQDYITVREVDMGGDPKDDFVDYDPVHGASDQHLTTFLDEMLVTMRQLAQHA
tara:strand:+ start:669 stop:878 length:210 start_codon:yes stop_codon:yes gene_type:complete